MANEQAPMIRVVGFHTTYEIHPKRGNDPLNDTVDAKGFLLDDKGRRVMENVQVDWVTYAPAGNITGIQNVERVKALIPGPKHVGQMGAIMRGRWDQIEPSYKAWKSGQEIPLDGTPLSAWAGVNSGQVDGLRSFGIRTIEELSKLTDSQLERIRLPNMRELRGQAKLFLESLDASVAAKREAEKDQEIASLKERMDEMAKLLEEKTRPDSDDSEVEQLRAALEAKGVQYNPRWAAPKLRAALAEAA